MHHPQTADGGWILAHVVFEDRAGIAVALLSNTDARYMLALRWTEPFPLTTPQGLRNVVPWTGEPTGWFIVPFSFAVAISRTLIELHTTAATPGFDESGYQALLNWLIDHEALEDGLAY